MKVGLEVSAAMSGRRSGVGNYVAHMIDGLQKIPEANSKLEMIYFSNRAEPAPHEQLTQLTAEAIYPHDRLPVRSVWMQLGLPRSLARTQPDLCHFPNYLAPIVSRTDIPFIATMYDMSVYRCPQYQPFKTVAMHRAIVPTVARSARLIITISESARQDILGYLKVPAERVRVVNGSAGPHFLAESPAVARGEPMPIEFRQRYGLNFPYILTVGTLEPRKNQARLIEAFTTLVQQERLPHHLLLVGAHGWKEGPIGEQVRKSGLSERIHFLGYVPNCDLPGLYREAAAFAFPSLYEGFGLPVLEAMACGAPCLISHDPALVEVSGDAAFVVNPFSTDDVAAGLYRLLTDRVLTTTLREKGLRRSAEFHWDRCAAETYQLYQEVVEEVAQPRVYPTDAADSALSETKLRLDDTILYQEQPAHQFNPSEARPTPLEQAILETILYSDIFNFPLTLEEIQRYLIGQAASLAEVEQALNQSSYLQSRIIEQAAFYSLRGREEVFERRKAQAATVAQNWHTARQWGRWLQLVPFLRGAVVTGGLAAESARPHDDIDLLLLVEPGRLWACRALVIGIVHLARLRGVELCPNYLMALSDEPLSLPQHDLYTARELANMRLLFGGAAYQKLLSLNTWLGDILPNAAAYSAAQPALLERHSLGRLGQMVKRLGEKLLGGRLGEKFEQWEQRKIARFNGQAGLEAYFTPDLCKGHFGNYGHETLRSFEQRCALLELNSSLADPNEVVAS